MTTLGDIEKAIEKLSPEELQALRTWFAERDAADWDHQFEEDVAAGKLDDLADEVIRNYGKGRP